ncbi:MAG: carboxypeptidase-like regulatory domain-containing protein [Terriglobia bacterium]
MSRMHLPRAAYWIFIFGMLLIAPLSAWAQTSVLATMTGVITDPSGAVIADVAITATNTGTQQIAKANTNPSGNYVLPDLPAGDYTFRAEKQGFQACESKGVHLDPAASVQVNCTMQLGQVTQTVEVQAQSVQVQVTDSKVTRTVDSTQMTDLPVNGRNFVSLLGLQPGVVQSFSFNSFQAMSLFASQCTQVNGLTGESNNLLIDGTPSTRTRANGATVALPSMDSISEVNIVTTGYMPEYSRAAGGQFAVNLKSGGDKYHGTVYEFIRNDALDSRNFFSATVPSLKFNDFGFTIGGPVIPKGHKLYFFLSEEWNKEVSGSTWVGTVPTANDRLGNLSDYCHVFSSCPTVPAYLGGQTIGGEALVAGQPFPGDIIPQSLFSANGSAMVGNLYVAPNTITQVAAYPYEGGNNFITTYNGPNDTHMYSIKGDYIPNDKNHLSVSIRHYFGNTSSAANGTGASSALIDQGYHWPSRGGSVDLTTTFSPTLLNDFSVGANEDINHIVLTNGIYGKNGLDRNSLGINFPYIIPGGDASKDIAGKIPTLILSGFDGVNGQAYPSGSIGHVYTLQDVITKIRGNHTVKVGVWWEHDGENDHDQVRVSPGGGVGNNLNGQFEFNAATTNPNSTGSPLADALLGNFDNYSELGWRNQTPWRAHQVGFFGQDSWKITPRFTLQGGMRWDVFQPYNSKWNNFAMFQPYAYSFLPGVAQVVDPSTGFIVGGNPYNGIVVPGAGVPNDAAGHFAVLGQALTTSNIASINQELQYYGMARGLSNSIIGTQWHDFQPRLGFAWDPKGDGKTSIRGGAGIFYNHNTLSDVTLEGGVTPYQLASEVFNGLADCPGSAVTASRTCSPSSATAPNLPIPMTGNDMINDTPVVYSWNFTVEHMFFNDTLISVGYVGNRARHMPINADLNEPAIGTFNTTLNPQNAGINQDALRPYPGIGGDATTLQEGNSKYDGLQVSVQRRLVKSLQYNVSYTYSKAFDMADNIYSVVTDTYNPKYNWEPSGFNQTHNLTTTWVYTLPFYRHATTWYGKAVGGWELSGDLALLSGFNKSITASGDPLGNGVGSIGGTEYAAVKSGCNYRGSRTVSQFFNTSCFSQPSAATSTLYGTVEPNAIEGPGIDNLDLALLKNGPITEWLKYQFRAEFFNILNHPSFNSIDTTVTDSTFGVVNGAADPREIQFALKLIF